MTIGEPLINSQEDVSDRELEIARHSGESAIWAFQQERVHSLRAAILAKLTKHGIDPTDGWAIFDVVNDESGNVMTADPYKRVLLVSWLHETPTRLEGHPVPSVRIITNERYRILDRLPQIFSEDFGLDDEDDVHYYVDAIDIAAFRGKDPKARALFRKSMTPIILPGSDGKISSNVEIKTMPIKGVNLTDQPHRESFPLGSFASPTDSLYMLERGQDLFASIESLDPTRTSLTV